jgi:hypothetical protein
MGHQIILRSQGLNHDLALKTTVYGKVEITRSEENGVAILEISDPNAVLELVVREKNGDVSKPSSIFTMSPRAGSVSLDEAANRGGATTTVNFMDEMMTEDQSEKNDVSIKKRKACDQSNDKNWKIFGAIPPDSPVATCWKDDERLGRRENDTATKSEEALENTDEPTTDNLSRVEAASVLTALATSDTRTKKYSLLDEKWSTQYNKLVAYKLEHGSCGISGAGKNGTYRNLEQWVAGQRRLFRDGELSERRLAKLIEFGLFSDDETRNFKRTINGEDGLKDEAAAKNDSAGDSNDDLTDLSKMELVPREIQYMMKNGSYNTMNWWLTNMSMGTVMSLRAQMQV